ncbi:MAG: DUF58 domain-containing protein [Rhodocyclaceae bacterium]|nr:DUF58 domain-containing protein [Rhodocyclaceae bacterium]
MKLATALQERFATWALRTRPPETTPIVLVQRRVYVLPTRAGLVFAVSLAVMLLGAINYNLSLGHALVFLLAGLGITAILHTFRNLVGISITTGRAEPVFAGEIAHFSLVLHNPRHEERRLIRLSLPGGSEASVDLPPAAAAEARLGRPSTRRGWLALPRVTIETVYPLGLVRTWSYAAPAMHCLVYPQPAADAPPLPTGLGTAGGRMQNASGSEDFAGLRGHQPADPPRHVAWKTAARQDAAAPLLTKQFSGASADILWLDWDATPDGLATETRLSILARWVLDAAASGVVWGFRLPAAVLPPACGDAHLHACLKALALHEDR